MMSINPKPAQVLDAILHQDTMALSAMGRKGGRVAAKNRAQKKKSNEEQERLAQDFKKPAIGNSVDISPNREIREQLQLNYE